MDMLDELEREFKKLKASQEPDKEEELLACYQDYAKVRALVEFLEEQLKTKKGELAEIEKGLISQIKKTGANNARFGRDMAVVQERTFVTPVDIIEAKKYLSEKGFHNWQDTTSTRFFSWNKVLEEAGNNGVQLPPFLFKIFKKHKIIIRRKNVYNKRKMD